MISFWDTNSCQAAWLSAYKPPPLGGLLLKCHNDEALLLYTANFLEQVEDT